jgi:hypothetical protein
MKDKAMGDYAPSHTPYFDVGRFRFIAIHNPEKVWLRDMESGEGGEVEVKKLEAVLLKFHGGSF